MDIGPARKSADDYPKDSARRMVDVLGDLRMRDAGDVSTWSPCTDGSLARRIGGGHRGGDRNRVGLHLS